MGYVERRKATSGQGVALRCVALLACAGSGYARNMQHLAHLKQVLCFCFVLCRNHHRHLHLHPTPAHASILINNGVLLASKEDITTLQWAAGCGQWAAIRGIVHAPRAQSIVLLPGMIRPCGAGMNKMALSLEAEACQAPACNGQANLRLMVSIYHTD